MSRKVVSREPGAVQTTVQYYAIDVAGNAEAQKSRIVKIDKDTDGDGVYDNFYKAPTVPGLPVYQGCPFGIVNYIELRSTDTTSKPTVNTKAPLANVEKKVFAIESTAFKAMFGNNGNGVPPYQYLEVFEYGPAFNSGYTNAEGKLALGVPRIERYLEIAKYTDADTGTTVYTGRCTSAGDFKDDVNNDGIKETAQVKMHNIKTIAKLKNGTIVKQVNAGQSDILTGSYLQVIYPDFNIFTATNEVYTVVLDADSEWNVDMEITTPAGYRVIGDPRLLTTINNETQAFVFEIEDFASPDPNMVLTIKTLHKGKNKKVALTMSGKKKDVMDKIVKEAKEKHQDKVKAEAPTASSKSGSIWGRLWDSIAGLFR